MRKISETISHWEIGLMTLTLSVCFTLPFLLSDSLGMSSQPRVGGPCTYKPYKGEAEIISVNQKKDSSGAYEIKFSFRPHETIKEEFAKTEGRQWLLQNNYSDPDENFIKKNRIQVGKRFPCTMKVIIKGTCTPVLFEFSTIDQVRSQ